MQGNHHPCPLCGSDHTQVFLDYPAGSFLSDGGHQPWSLKKYLCQHCDLVFAPEDVPHRMLNYYRQDYSLGTHAQVSQSTVFSNEGQSSRSQAIYDWMFPLITAYLKKPNPSLCEVGAGSGLLLHQIRQRNQFGELFGIDVSEREVAIAQAMELPVQALSIDQVERRFDVVCSFTVLEHIADPHDFLAHCKRIANPGGIVAFTIPISDTPTYDLFVYDHLAHYQSYHIGKLLQRADLKLLHYAPGTGYFAGLGLFIAAHDDDGDSHSYDLVADVNVYHQAKRHYQALFAACDKWLESHPKFAVFGVGEKFDLLCAYTSMTVERVPVFIDDNQARAESKLGREVISKEAFLAQEQSMPVLFTFETSRTFASQICPCCIA